MEPELEDVALDDQSQGENHKNSIDLVRHIMYH
jgi:hypothetical protein